MDAVTPEPRNTPSKELARGVAWLVGTALAARFVETLIGQSPLGAALAGAIVVDLALTRAGVTWDDANNRSQVASRAWRGFYLGAGISTAVVAISILPSLIVGGATIGLGSPSLTLFFGTLRGAAESVREELLYRGLPLLVAERAGIARPWTIAFCVVAGVSPHLFDFVSFEALLQSAALGGLWTMLWVRTKGAWAPMFAHASWFVLAGIGLRGGILDVFWTSGMLAENGRTRGLPAIICFTATILLTAVISKKLAQSSETPNGQHAS